MGLFSRSSPPDAPPSRRYLRLAPPGPRTETLASACVARLRESPAASASRYGDVVTADELGSAVEVVREVMTQDRDLSAWVARKSMVQLNALLRGQGTGEDMSKGGPGDNTLLALTAVGLEPAGLADSGEVALHISAPEKLAEKDRAAALGVASAALAVLFAALGSPTAREKRFFVDLYTGESGTDVETKAYKITAWTAILGARLMNADVLTARFQHDYREIPAMWCAGWYPNPYNTGGIVNGDAQLQRFWDGSAWTDRARLRQRAGWTERIMSLHDDPTVE